MQKEASNERQMIAKKLEDFEEDYLPILERGINILDLSQKAAAIYQSKNGTERRAIMRDLFLNIRLNGDLIEVERTPLVAAIANKVKKKKELRNTFEQTISNKITKEEFVNGTPSPLWLEIVDLFQAFGMSRFCDELIKTLMTNTALSRVPIRPGGQFPHLVGSMACVSGKAYFAHR